MSTRIDDGGREGPRDEDDDWFAPLQQQPVVREESPREREPAWEPEEPEPEELGRRQIGIVIAVIAAVFLVLAGFLVGRTTKDSSTTVVTVTAAALAPETPTTTDTGDGGGAATTPTATTPTTPTTPTATTPAATTPSTTTPSADAVPTEATLRPGTKGSSSVAALQTALTTLGYAPGAADGSYGATTVAAVTAFQTASKLPADGVAGPKTLAAINAALASG